MTQADVERRTLGTDELISGPISRLISLAPVDTSKADRALRSLSLSRSLVSLYEAF